MFLYVSVILFTGGGCVLSQHALRVVSQHCLQQGGCLLWGFLLRGGVPAPGGGLLRGGEPAPVGCGDPLRKADGYSCGRYESYWNAFLFSVCFMITKMALEPPKNNFKKQYEYPLKHDTSIMDGWFCNNTGLNHLFKISNLIKLNFHYIKFLNIVLSTVFSITHLSAPWRRLQVWLIGQGRSHWTPPCWIICCMDNSRTFNLNYTVFG